MYPVTAVVFAREGLWHPRLDLPVLAASIAVIFTKETKLGLDLQGGSQLVYQAESTAQQQVDPEQRLQQREGAAAHLVGDLPAEQRVAGHPRDARARPHQEHDEDGEHHRRLNEKRRDLLMYAFEAAAAAGHTGEWDYVYGVLRRLAVRGITDLGDAEEYELENGR